MTDTPCRSWLDHDWADRKFLETGRHPTMGPYQRWTVRCSKCDTRTTETLWTGLFSAPHILEPDKLMR